MKRQEKIQLGYAINDVTRLLRRSFDSRVRKYGLTRAQWQVLGYLIRTDGQTQIELAVQLDMEPAPVGRLLDKLERQDWVVRKADNKDRRVRKVFKTNKIMPLVAELEREANALMNSALGGCNEQMIRTFTEVLSKMKTNLLEGLRRTG